MEGKPEDRENKPFTPQEGRFPPTPSSASSGPSEDSYSGTSGSSSQTEKPGRPPVEMPEAGRAPVEMPEFIRLQSRASDSERAHLLPYLNFMAELRANKTQDDKEAETSEQKYREQLLEYYLYNKKVEATTYKYLSFTQTLAVLPKLPTALVALGVGGFLKDKISFITQAFAQTPPPFVPPFGLSQQDYRMIILGFAGLLAVMVIGLVYAGFLARPKNLGAAAAVQHLVTFIAGALLGAKA